MTVSYRGIASVLLCSLLTAYVVPSIVTAAEFPSVSRKGVDSPSFRIRTHRLSVQVIPDRHHLAATDLLTVETLLPDQHELSLSLSDAFQILSIALAEDQEDLPPFSATVVPQHVPSSKEPSPGLQEIQMSFAQPLPVGRPIKVTCRYEGTLNHPPTESSHLRFVAPDQTVGHIGSEGVYLSGETHWYLEDPGSLPRFSLEVTLPQGWMAVTHGQEVSRQTDAGVTKARWNVDAKTEALTLVANRFVHKRDTWKGVELSTYLFQEDARLANVYLSAMKQYLERYSNLLGPYPFPKFSVVENFFPSGLGMPSFTLLGSGVIKRKYIQPYALGHEIVHSWIGNWVFNDGERGNWVEGLTTYLANYYYEEVTGTPEQARELRRKMFWGYAVYVNAGDDYPLRSFRYKRDQQDNAIGYQKAAMVFHMLRREIGDTAFWSALRSLVARFREAFATWEDLEREFAKASGRDLRWFFEQWVERSGAPTLSVKDVRLDDSNGTARLEEPRPRKMLRFRVVQDADGDTPFRIRLPLRILLEHGETVRQTMILEQAEQPFHMDVPRRPVRLDLDPDYNQFRRIPRRNLPPMLNLFVTDRDRSLIGPDHGDLEERAPYEGLMAAMAGKDEAESIVRQLRPEDANGSVLVLGGPSVNSSASWAVAGCGKRVRLRSDGFSIGEHSYTSADSALLVSCRRPDHPEHVVTLFYGLTPAAAGKVTRLLFFYGWDSYVVFRNGRVEARGVFPSGQNNGEVGIDGS